MVTDPLGVVGRVLDGFDFTCAAQTLAAIDERNGKTPMQLRNLAREMLEKLLKDGETEAASGYLVGRVIQSGRGKKLQLSMETCFSEAPIV